VLDSNFTASQQSVVPANTWITLLSVVVDAAYWVKATVTVSTVSFLMNGLSHDASSCLPIAYAACG
jgi:hypothetical protein